MVQQRFMVRKGTACLTRQVGETEWQDGVSDADRVYTVRRIDKETGGWVFEQNGVEVRPAAVVILGGDEWKPKRMGRGRRTRTKAKKHYRGRGR